MRWMQRAVFFLTAVGVFLAADDSYRLQIEKDRGELQNFLRSEKSPLRLIGRLTLKKGDSRIGSDPAAELRLPARAPGQLGTVHRRGADISFEPAPGVSVSLNDQPASSQFPLRAALLPKPADRVGAGDFTLVVRAVGDEFVLLVTDAHSELLKAFNGPTWFPVDEGFRIRARFQPVDSPRKITMEMTDGNSTTYQIAGDLLFEYAGQTFRLEAFVSADNQSLFVPFRDQTSGKETYGGGRFLEADRPKDGRTVLDFNKAFNPYCAYSPYAICPVVPRENRLSLAVRAGETLVVISKH
jgi:uncharacterized protein (DUF1684 family)